MDVNTFRTHRCHYFVNCIFTWMLFYKMQQNLSIVRPGIKRGCILTIAVIIVSLCCPIMIENMTVRSWGLLDRSNVNQLYVTLVRMQLFCCLVTIYLKIWNCMHVSLQIYNEHLQNDLYFNFQAEDKASESFSKWRPGSFIFQWHPVSSNVIVKTPKQTWKSKCQQQCTKLFLGFTFNVLRTMAQALILGVPDLDQRCV